jgi:uncharacterized membrane protein required for colicin V production
MFLDILHQLRWLDLVVIILLVRIGYIAIKSGLSVEIFKLLGTLLATYIALHYYTIGSDYLRTIITYKEVPLELLDFFSFLLLAISGYSVFVLLRSIFYRFIKMEAVPGLNKWGGLVLGAARGLLFVGLIVFALAISSVSYLKNSVADSYSGRRILKVAPAAYAWLWGSIGSKFMSGDVFNKTVTEVQENFAQK